MITNLIVLFKRSVTSWHSWHGSLEQDRWSEHRIDGILRLLIGGGTMFCVWDRALDLIWTSGQGTQSTHGKPKAALGARMGNQCLWELGKMISRNEKPKWVNWKIIIVNIKEASQWQAFVRSFSLTTGQARFTYKYLNGKDMCSVSPQDV